MTHSAAPLSETQERQLAVLGDIAEVSALAGTKSCIWAGLVPDILAGQFLREHGDVDAFTLNLWELKDVLTGLFEKRGYTVSTIAEVDFLRIERNGIHAVFNQLELDGDTALWRHAGAGGTLYFPASWLPARPTSFYGIPLNVSGIEFEYAIKTHPELLNPGWKGRKKDAAAIEWLERAMAEQKLDREQILKRVWSYNPFWAKRGYAAYRMPIVAWPLAPEAE